MKMTQCNFIIGTCFISLITFICGTEVIAGTNNNGGRSLLLAKAEDDIVIYKKDIIISSDELKEESKDDAEEFKQIEIPVSRKAESLNIRLETLSLDIVDKYIKEGKKYEARNALSDIFLSKKYPEKQKEIKGLLDKLNEELIFSSTPSPDAPIYMVQPGDVLANIAKQFGTNYELIMRINRKSNTRINVGERLKILTGKTQVLVSKRDFTLTLLLNDHYVKQYRIGVGKGNKTPEDNFGVKNRMKEPTWFSPQGGVYPYGHEENILGTRWIGFKDKPDLYGFGIHGTTQPESIGTASSNGCVRMINNDVEELYDFITLDTEIIIQG
jgi:LysM repeat protein